MGQNLIHITVWMYLCTFLCATDPSDSLYNLYMNLFISFVFNFCQNKNLDSALLETVLESFIWTKKS